MAQFNFNANAVEPMQAREYAPLPEGTYDMMIIKSEIKPTKAGTGYYLELVMQVVAGTHSGRRLWERLNIDNPNKQAEDIAKQALAALCKAVGLDDLTDTEQLHDVPFIANIEIDRKEPNRNRIVGYAALEVPGKPAAPARAPAAKPAAPATNKRPWQAA